MQDLRRCNNNGCITEPPTKCVYYDGPYLPNLDVFYKENLTSILQKINALIGTGGGGGNLQQVTTAGNTTNRSIILTGQGGYIPTTRGMQLYFTGAGGFIQSYGSTNNLQPITLRASHVTMLSTTSGLDAVNGDDYVTLNQVSVDFDDDYFDI